MKQLSIFQKDDKLSSEINKVTDIFKQVGRLSQFIENRIRSVEEVKELNPSAVFSNLRELKNVVVTILYTLKEISPERRLKMDIFKFIEKYFDTHIDKKDLSGILYKKHEVRGAAENLSYKVRLSYLKTQGISQYLPNTDILDDFENKIDVLYEYLMKLNISLERLL